MEMEMQTHCVRHIKYLERLLPEAMERLWELNKYRQTKM